MKVIFEVSQIYLQLKILHVRVRKGIYTVKPPLL